MSLRASTVPPVACSGDMYAAVPAIVPGALSPPSAVCVRWSLGRIVTATQLGQAEIKHLHGAIGADHDVGRFQIAMDDAAGVRRRQRIGDRNGDPEHLAEAQAVARNERIQALARARTPSR